MKLPRGIRNNNPLNIKIGNDWQGERANTDGVFEEFVTMQFGFRAAFIILKKYIKKYGRNTIRKIVHSWSPDGEKAESAYMSCVSQWAGIALDDVIEFEDKESMCKIVQGMARVENGRTIGINVIEEAYEMLHQ
jgi:hypothetical protein